VVVEAISGVLVFMGVTMVIRAVKIIEVFEAIRVATATAAAVEVVQLKGPECQ
jgi:hypothetical protein